MSLTTTILLRIKNTVQNEKNIYSVINIKYVIKQQKEKKTGYDL